MVRQPRRETIFADPVSEVLRPTLTPRAGPASPARLPVYPMTERGDDGMGFVGGENLGERIFAVKAAEQLSERYNYVLWMACGNRLDNQVAEDHKYNLVD